MNDIGVENISTTLKSSLNSATKEATTFKTLQSITNYPSSFVSNDIGILSLNPTYHDLQPWLANDFQEHFNIALYQPIVSLLPMVPEGYKICDICKNFTRFNPYWFVLRFLQFIFLVLSHAGISKAFGLSLSLFLVFS